MKRLSLSETARRFGISKGYLSRRVHAGKPAKGHDLHLYAAMQDGKICGFDLPESMIPPPKEESGPSQDGETGKRRENVASGVASVSSDEENTKKKPLLEVNRDAVRDVLGMEERENPSGEGVAQSVALGMAAKEGVDLIKALRAPLENGDPDAAARFLDRLKQVLLDLVPFVGAGFVLWLLRDRPAFVQVTGSLGAGAGLDILSHGEESMVARALRGEPPKSVHVRTESQQSQDQSDMGDKANEGIPSTLGDGESVGDSMALDMDVGLDRIGSEPESASSSKE